MQGWAMRKMPCLFVRKFHDHRTFTITPDVTPGCEWVLAGEGWPYLKRDGTACAVIGGELYRRYDAKRGKKPPEGAIPCSEPDEVTGHWPHWIRVGDGPQDKWYREAWERSGVLRDGTYELCGPHFNGNHEQLSEDRFISHMDPAPWPPYGAKPSFELLEIFLKEIYFEGLVYHHPDGRMAKIRRRDFGLEWPVKR